MSESGSASITHEVRALVSYWKLERERLSETDPESESEKDRSSKWDRLPRTLRCFGVGVGFRILLLVRGKRWLRLRHSSRKQGRLSGSESEVSSKSESDSGSK